MTKRNISSLLRSMLALAAVAVLLPAGAVAQTSSTASPPPPPPDTVVVNPPPEPLPPGAAPPSLIRKVESRFSDFVGGTENADSLAVGLRNGYDVTLVRRDERGVIVEEVTFTPPTGHMGVGNVMHSLNVAGRVLVREGVVEPTPEQLTAALIGGTITRPDGTKVLLTGVLDMRADGMGWGQISKELGVKHSGGHGPSSAPFVPAQQVKFIERRDDRRRDRVTVAASGSTIKVSTAGAADVRREDRRADRREDGSRDTSGRGRSDRAETQGRPEKAGVDRVARVERIERPEKAERPEKPERPERPEKIDKPEKLERIDRPERGGGKR